MERVWTHRCQEAASAFVAKVAAGKSIGIDRAYQECANNPKAIVRLFLRRSPYLCRGIHRKNVRCSLKAGSAAFAHRGSEFAHRTHRMMAAPEMRDRDTYRDARMIPARSLLVPVACF